MTAQRKYNKGKEVLDYVVNNFHKSPDYLAERFGLTVGTIYNYRMQAKKILEQGVKPVLHLVPEMEVPQETKRDMVNHPPHYTDGGIETIDYIRAKLTPEEFRGYCRGNALKYLSRAGKKGDPAEDLAKAQWYLERIGSV